MPASTIALIISHTLTFVIGIAIGYLTKSQIQDDIITKNAKTIVLLAVTIMWTISVAVSVINPQYQTNPLIHGLMGSIVGFFYKFEPKKDK